jgi:putative methyltransferase (TIGR04325 family)
MKVVRRLLPFVPPALVAWVRPGIRFRGPYTSWAEAARGAEGYDAPRIVAKVRDAMRKVVHGEAVCERDSVLFDEPIYPFPLIAILQRAAAENGQSLAVLDYGGALGSSYYQCRDFLGHIEPLRWWIVEQPAFVECGRLEFQSEVIQFFESIAECLTHGRPQVVLLSSVLQYLPDPWSILDTIADIGAPYVVIDRTPIAASGTQMITVQVVPATIYRSSYPAWLFNEEALKAPLLRSYSELSSFRAVDGDLGSGSLGALCKGFIFRRQDRAAARHA